MFNQWKGLIRRALTVLLALRVPTNPATQRVQSCNSTRAEASSKRYLLGDVFAIRCSSGSSWPTA